MHFGPYPSQSNGAPSEAEAEQDEGQMQSSGRGCVSINANTVAYLQQEQYERGYCEKGVDVLATHDGIVRGRQTTTPGGDRGL